MEVTRLDPTSALSRWLALHSVGIFIAAHCGRDHRTAPLTRFIGWKPAGLAPWHPMSAPRTTTTLFDGSWSFIYGMSDLH